MKILILYTRLTGYWMSCMRYDHSRTGNHYLVIRKTPAKDAPFRLSSETGIELMDGDAFSASHIKKLTQEFNPSLVYVAGWNDKRYLGIAKYFKKQGIPVITGMDNHWLGNCRQQFASLFSNRLVRQYFTHIWVPGKPQYYFARKLGFAPQQILTRLYCADEELFGKLNQNQYRKQITFAGRLVEHKGLRILFNVLNQLIEEKELGIDVHIIGNGPLASEIPDHQRIKHTPFVNPVEMPKLLENAGYFILPSLYEAWGVVVHEAVLAGLPVITTQQCGAATDFVISGYNGFIYNATQAEQLKTLLLKISGLTEKEYMQMSAGSKKLASVINLDVWSATINSIVK